MVKHTKTPWSCLNGVIKVGRIFNNYSSKIAVVCTDKNISLEEAEENAKIIVKAVNCHEELVEALRNTISVIEYLSGTTKHSIIYNDAQKSLQKASE